MIPQDFIFAFTLLFALYLISKDLLLINRGRVICINTDKVKKMAMTWAGRGGWDSICLHYRRCFTLSGLNIWIHTFFFYWKWKYGSHYYQTGVLQNNILILQSFYLSIVYFLVILLFYVFIATCFLTKAFYCICKLRTINRSKKNLYIFGICLSLSLAGSFPASSFWRDPDRFLYTYLVFIRYYLGFFF